MSYKKYNILILTSVLSIIFCLYNIIYSQESTQSQTITDILETEKPIVTTQGPKLSADEPWRNKILKQELSFSSIQELRARARNLSLADTGDKNTIIARIIQYYKLDDTNTQALPQENNTSASTTQLTIKNANNTNYFNIKEIKENYVVLSGEVQLLITDTDNNVHNIQAGEIIYNRNTNIFNAHYNVNYIFSPADGNEKMFVGDSLLFYINTNDTIFVNANSSSQSETERAENNDSNDNSFRFYATSILRNKDNVIILHNAFLTTSSHTPSGYSIRSQDVWVLNNGEWGLYRAALFLGHIPIMPFPAFFYPNSPMIFHPSVGFNDNIGSYIQTSTFFQGSPQTDDSADDGSQDIFNFFNALTDDTEQILQQKRQGLFLHQTKTPIITEKNVFQNTLVWFNDFYTHLGFMSAIKFHTTLEDIIPSLDIIFGIAFTPHLYKSPINSTRYTLYRPENNTSSGTLNLIQNPILFNLPLRLYSKIQGNIIYKDLKLDFNIPFYTDPLYEQHYLDNRKYSINWGQLIGFTNPTDNSTFTLNNSNNQLTDSGLSDMTQNLKLSYTIPTIKAITRNIITELAINEFTINMIWKQKKLNANATDANNNNLFSPEVREAVNSPELYFFYPEVITIPNMRLKMSGTFIDYPSVSSKNNTKTLETIVRIPKIIENNDNTEELDNTIDDTTSKDNKSVENSNLFDNKNYFRIPPLFIPDKNQKAKIGLLENPIKFAVHYTIDPRIHIQTRYYSQKFKTIDDITLQPDYINFELQNNAQLNYNMHVLNELINYTGNTTLQAIYQTLYVPDASQITQTIQDSLELNAEKARTFNLQMKNNMKIYPFILQKALKNTSISYTLDFLPFIYKYDTTSQTLQFNTIQFETEYITKHSIETTFGFSLYNPNHTFSVSFNTQLPPEVTKFTSTFTAKLFDSFLSFNMQGGIMLEDTKKGNPEKWDLLINSVSINIFPWLILSSGMNINIENSNIENITPQIIIGPLTASMAFAYDTAYEANQQQGKFLSIGSKAIRANEFTLGYELSDKNIGTLYVWKNRISLGLKHGITWKHNLLQFTKSNILFTLGISFKIYKFLEFELSMSSTNTQIYRYFPSYAKQLGIQSINIFTDLLQSFNIFNTNDRRSSLFNLNQITFKITHTLGDWNIIFDYTGKPILNNTSKLYEWNGNFSISIAWKSISPLQKNIKYEQNTNTLKVY